MVFDYLSIFAQQQQQSSLAVSLYFSSFLLAGRGQTSAQKWPTTGKERRL
jgi:hypothetical protein